MMSPMSDLLITSPANGRLRALVGLRRRRTREESGTTLVEGCEELTLALDAGVEPRVLFYCPELHGADERHSELIARARAAGAETIQVGRVAFERVAYREGPDGFLAVVPSTSTSIAALRPTRDGLSLVCQGVEKPGNLGAMLRSADAAGVDAVLAADPVTDWGNPNVVRASKGTVFSVPCVSATTEQTLQWLAEHEVTLVATTPDTDVVYTDIDYSGRVAVAVGAEKHGLTRDLLAAADQRVRIPMFGRANSLNVAASAAIVLFEAVRQRRSRSTY